MSPTGLLDTWLAPLDVETFRDEYFARRSLYREGNPARLGALAGLRTWDALDILGAQKGDVLAWFTTNDGRHMTADVSAESARKLFQAGTTMYVKEPPEFGPVREALARALSLPADNLQCNLFCNQPGAKTRAHFDPVDTLTVQITGRKRWRIAPNRHAPDPTLAWATLDRTMRSELRLYAEGPMPDRLPEGEVEDYLLEPGAVLYVPRGYWHETESDEPSISLHVHHIPVPWVDAVLVALRGKLLRDPAWRASALTLWDPAKRPAAEASLDGLLGSLAAAAADLAPDDVLPTPRSRAGAVRPGARFARRALTGMLVEPGGEDGKARRVTFSTVEQGTERRSTVEMSEEYLHASRLFGASPVGDHLAASDLAARVPGLTLDEAVSLINLLLDVGFLRPVSLLPTPAPYAGARSCPEGTAPKTGTLSRTPRAGGKTHALASGATARGDDARPRAGHDRAPRAS